MAFSLNRATLIGNLGADPESKTLPSGNEMCNLRIATSESWVDKSTGERKEKTEWHTVVIFTDGLAKIAQQHLRKGSRVCVEGKLVTRKWADKDGKDKYSTEVVLQGPSALLIMLDGKGSEGAPAMPKVATPAAPIVGALAGTELDDELPF